MTSLCWSIQTRPARRWDLRATQGMRRARARRPAWTVRVGRAATRGEVELSSDGDHTYQKLLAAVNTFLLKVLLGARSSHTTRPSHDVGDEPIVSGSFRASRVMAVVFPCDLVIRFCAQITSHQHLRWSRFHSICSHHRRRQTPANVPCCACTAGSCERSARSCGDSCWL